MRIKLIASLLILGATLVLTSCEARISTSRPQAHLDQLRETAAADAERSVTDSYEIQNIHDRRVLFGHPGLVGYVVFLNGMGQPVEYFPVRGKCTSSNKRLTPGQQILDGDYDHQFLANAPSEDGTYGQSDEYIYCFSPDGRYHQWNGDYYYSNRPVELSIRPLIVSQQARDDQRTQGQ